VTFWVSVNTTNALRELELDEKAEIMLCSDDLRTVKANNDSDYLQRKKYRIINEPGLYSLTLRSRKLEARAFKRWVTHRVLSAIPMIGRHRTDPERGKHPVPIFTYLKFCDYEDTWQNIFIEISH